ncbi:diguanylate cyclase [Deinococcus sp. ME38]|uniref:diguanylate cyclase n=1 Tax=Deinococcus sp. ME38 TaxID=3400344 RepID=UPI003B5C630B
MNDRYGHAEGDRVIRVLADVLREHAAPQDLLTRHGGEEFVWVTGISDEGALLARVNALRVSFAHRVEVLGVTVSAGVAVTTLPPGDPASALPELLRRADEALYQAKAAGRNQARLAS